MKAKIDKSTAFNGVVVLTGSYSCQSIKCNLPCTLSKYFGDEGLYAYQQVYPIVALGLF